MVVALIGGCASTSATDAAVPYGVPTGAAPLVATSPYLRMTGPAAGWAVWPSGDAWLLLRTSDGFAHVSNATPVAVETAGGLVASALAVPAGAPDRIAVAVGSHGRLLRSPVLSGDGGTDWMPAELPGPVSTARDGIAITGQRLTAVTADGAVLEQTPSGWRTLTTAAGSCGG